MDTLTARFNGRPAKQQGFTLIMTLIILVVITLSSLAMIIATRAGISASGNIAFRQAAVRVADVAVQDAFAWMNNQLVDANALNANIPAMGYFATSNFATGCTPTNLIDPTRSWAAQWKFPTNQASNQCAKYFGTISGYDLYYVIHRMANQPLSCAGGGQCMVPPATVVDWVPKEGDSQAGGRGAAFSRTNEFVYYRITVKVAGPRNNTRYVQSFVY